MHRAAIEKSKNGSVLPEDSLETEAYRKLRSIEEMWDQFILDVEDAMVAKYQENNQNCIEIIDHGTIRMMDCEKMREVALRDVLNPKFGHYTLFVLLRTILGGTKWRQLTGVTFPVLADEASEFVGSLQFGVSVLNMCNTTVFNKVGKLLAADEPIFKAFVDDNIHDFYQLGGDVIVDSQGKLVYLYKSKHSEDRPTISDLLERISTFENENPFTIRSRKTPFTPKVDNAFVEDRERCNPCCTCSLM
uniref:Uncharacterized protein n=1 Tax=Plectus sambesii TaxID=2011161 RepID=A0A914UUM0_9BILA